MKRFLIVILSLCCGLFSVASFSSEQEMPAPASNPQFDAIKSLAGTWVGTGKMNGKDESVKTTYRITSGGTAVEETLFPGTPHEMVSVYFLDGNDVMMTHYCALGNQPRMKASEMKKTKKGEEIAFKMVDATGMKSTQDPHMGALTLTMKGNDRLVESWEHEGPKGNKMAVFTYQREK